MKEKGSHNKSREPRSNVNGPRIFAVYAVSPFSLAFPRPTKMKGRRRIADRDNMISYGYNANRFARKSECSVPQLKANSINSPRNRSPKKIIRPRIQRNFDESVPKSIVTHKIIPINNWANFNFNFHFNFSNECWIKIRRLLDSNGYRFVCLVFWYSVDFVWRYGRLMDRWRCEFKVSIFIPKRGNFLAISLFFGGAVTPRKWNADLRSLKTAPEKQDWFFLQAWSQLSYDRISTVSLIKFERNHSIFSNSS